QQPAKVGLPIRITSPQPPSPQVPRHRRILDDLLLDLFETTLGELAALGLCTAFGFPLQVVAESGELQLGALGGPAFGAARTVGAVGRYSPQLHRQHSISV